MKVYEEKLRKTFRLQHVQVQHASMQRGSKVGSHVFWGHCLVIHREMICHYGATLLCLKPPQRFSREMWQKQGFH